MAAWIADYVDPFPSGLLRGLAPEAHADSAIRAVESTCTRLRLDRSLFPAVAFNLVSLAATRGSEQRKAGRLDDARDTAACFTALAERLTRRDPGEPLFHLMRCQAFLQQSKNAWKIGDLVAVKDALWDATGEAGTALKLDPRSVDARQMLAALQEKLVGLASEQPPSR